MKNTLSGNIRTLRRERGMTQEQLAEAMGVTVGAVHKWESKASIPEVRLLMEMADLFEVSVDALLGYKAKNNSVEDIIERIRDGLRTKDFDSALAEADRALRRYPNTFSIVYCCADAYERKGLETGDEGAVRYAISLMERSIPLLSQNSDPEISEVTIRSDIATCHIVLRQYDRGIGILKKYNAGGINNSLLGMTCSQQQCFDRKDAETYLVKAFSGVVTHAVRCMSGYVNYFINLGKPAEALEASLWLVQFLDSLKADRDSMSYPDRLSAVFRAAGAGCLLRLGKKKESEQLLLEAYRQATAFDAAPVYGAYALKFCIGDTAKTTASDDLGETVVEAVEKLLNCDEGFRPLLKTWSEFKSEYPFPDKEEHTDE